MSIEDIKRVMDAEDRLMHDVGSLHTLYGINDESRDRWAKYVLGMVEKKV